MIDCNIHTRRWWLNLATHSYDGWNLWWEEDLKGFRLAFVTVVAGPRNKTSNIAAFKLDKRYGRKYFRA